MDAKQKAHEARIMDAKEKASEQATHAAGHGTHHSPQFTVQAGAQRTGCTEDRCHVQSCSGAKYDSYSLQREKMEIFKALPKMATSLL